MKKGVRILGKKAIPIWLLVLALVATGAGAAAGTVLAGKVTGEVPVAVSQALLVNNVDWLDSIPLEPTHAPQQIADHYTWVSAPNREFAAVSDDNTGFQAAAELAIGDWAAFEIPLKNASDVDLVGLLTLNVPVGLEAEVYNENASGNVTSVVRIGLNTWKFKLKAAADYDGTNDTLIVVVSVDDTVMPGYYTISGTIKQIGY